MSVLERPQRVLLGYKWSLRIFVWIQKSSTQQDEIHSARQPIKTHQTCKEQENTIWNEKKKKQTDKGVRTGRKEHYNCGYNSIADI